MLLGNAISGTAIGINHCLTQVVYILAQSFIDQVPILHKLNYIFHLERVDGKWGGDYF
jgi:hypothetical protein